MAYKVKIIFNKYKVFGQEIKISVLKNVIFLPRSKVFIFLNPLFLVEKSSTKIDLVNSTKFKLEKIQLTNLRTFAGFSETKAVLKMHDFGREDKHFLKKNLENPHFLIRRS